MPQGSVMRRDSTPPGGEKTLLGETGAEMFIVPSHILIRPAFRGDQPPGLDEVQDDRAELHGVCGQGDRSWWRQCPGKATAGQPRLGKPCQAYFILRDTLGLRVYIQIYVYNP